MKTPAYLANDKLPRWGQWVMVVTPFGRCLGFLDPQGEWRDACDGHIIESVVSWSRTTMKNPPAEASGIKAPTKLLGWYVRRRLMEYRLTNSLPHIWGITTARWPGSLQRMVGRPI
jgi:hypothetical protein